MAKSQSAKRPTTTQNTKFPKWSSGSSGRGTPAALKSAGVKSGLLDTETALGPKSSGPPVLGPQKPKSKVRACHTLQQKSQKFNLTVCEGRLLRKVLLLFGHRAKVSCDDAEKLPVQQKSDRPWRTGRASERQSQSENGCGGKAQS